MIGAFLDTLCIMTITLDTSDNAIDLRFLFHMHILVDGFQLRELSDHWLRLSYVPITRDTSNSSPNSESSWLWIRHASYHDYGLDFLYSSHFFAFKSGIIIQVAFVIVGEVICSSIRNKKRLLDAAEEGGT